MDIYQNEEADWKHPSFMQLSAFENIVLFHSAVFFSPLSWKWLV